MHRFLAVVAAAASVPVSLCAADATYLFAIDSKASSAGSSIEISAPLAGTFIGNYDPRTNPGGTQTRPGLFGGSGNNPIAYEATITLEEESSTPPGGALSILPDFVGQIAAITGLAIDLLGGEPVAVGVGMTIEYDSFNTINPSAIYPGGIPVPISLGELAQISALIAVQSGPAFGNLAPAGPDTWQINAAVPIDLLVVGDVLGTPIGGEPVPSVLPINGLLVLQGGSPATAQLQATGNFAFVADQKVELPPIENLPVPVPTVLPPGGTANLLLSGTISSIAFDVQFGIDLVADGVRVQTCVPADLNCDGVVDGADLGLLLGAWGGPGPGDLDGNGVVDGADLGALLSAWTV